MRFSSKKKAGFTSAELVVAIVMIAMLAAILFPVVVRAGANEDQQAKCLNNLKQLALADKMYQEEWDGYLVPGHGYTTGTGGHYCWASLLAPYINSWKILVCPTQPELNSKEYWSHLGAPAPLYGGYGINDIADWPADTPMGDWVMYVEVEGGNDIRGIHRPKASELTHPDKTIDFADSYASSTYIEAHEWMTATDWVNELWRRNATDLPGARFNAVANRHNEGANFAFCDGHAKWMKQTEERNWTAKDLP